MDDINKAHSLSDDEEKLIEDEELIKSIGRNLRHFRKVNRKSQEEMAELSKMSTSNYKKLEGMNSKNPSIKSIVRACKSLNIPFDYLLKDSGIKISEVYARSEMFEEIMSYSDEDFEIFKSVFDNLYEIIKKRKSISDNQDK